ncbi:MAG: site-2 protease family protein [Promethearchaeota archaeon]
MSFLDIILEFILNPYFIISLIFWVIVSLAVYLLRNRKGSYSFFFPLLAMFKTKRLNNLIRKIAAKKPRFWRIFWNIGIFISFGFTIYGLYFFFSNLINLIFFPRPEQGVVPLIPGLTVNLPTLFYFILPLLFLLTTHEFAHGISASIDGVDIKSTGVMGVGVFYIIGFGAFVEVDEWELNSSKYNRNTRFRIAGAGTYVNAITAGIAFILLITFPYIVSPFYKQVTQVYNVLEPYQGGFNYGNLESGDAIDAIKMQNETDNKYVYLDELQGINLNTILNNETRIKCSVGDNLTFKIYNPFSDTYSEKNVTLGPRYYLGLEYEYPSSTQLKITYNHSSQESLNLIITKINGTSINVTNRNTLEKVFYDSFLTSVRIKFLNLSAGPGENYLVNVSVTGVYIGIQSTLYWMHKNDFAKFFTANWPDFWQKEIGLLFVFAFSLVLFNTMPLPIFDGDRMLKEVINWIYGEKYQDLKKKKKDRFVYKEKDTECNLSEYHVENIEYVKIELKDKSESKDKSEIILGEENYELIDKIGDGFKDTVLIKLPEDSKIKRDTIFEISYEYLYDEKSKNKKLTLNIIRIITTIIVLGNFLLTFIRFGFKPIFWV